MILKYRLKAFTVIESVVAMVILLIVFAIAITIFVQLNKSGFDLQKEQAAGALASYMQQSISKNELDNVTENFEGWQVQRSGQAYTRSDSLWELRFTLFKKDSTQTAWMERRMLVPTSKRNISDQ